LDQYLAATFPDLTRSRIQALLVAGHVLLSGKHPKSSQRLRGGEEVLVHVPAPTLAVPVAEALPLAILYEDKDLAVVNKVAGMVVHPGAGHAQGTLVNALLHRLEGLSGVGGQLRPGIVHRLDKETSGCLVVAKNDFALERLQTAFQERRVEKRYLAIVHGHPPPQVEIETFYGRHPRHRKRFTGRLPKGKKARTSLWTREVFPGAALVELELHTGRTHQIRVHLSELGYPLLGDVLYGGSRKGSPIVKSVQSRLARQALHAWKLAFEHPRTGRRLALEAAMPTDLMETLLALRATLPSIHRPG
jgi:23S rRNA pseudouridine1911/1915/1917 synthase